MGIFGERALGRVQLWCQCFWHQGRCWRLRQGVMLLSAWMQASSFPTSPPWNTCAKDTSLLSWLVTMPAFPKRPTVTRVTVLFRP